MPEEFIGYHSEWNLGSPGGWDYQRMAQEIGKLAWQRIRKKINLPLELDFEAPILNPVPGFAQLLLRAHKKNFPHQEPFIALVAEEETLDKVGENIHFVKYLNTRGIKAKLVSPKNLELRNNDIYIGKERVTSIFLDFNNKVVVNLKKKMDTSCLLTAFKKDLVTNPRGMEPIGAKGVFEALTSEYKNMISPTTLKRTPWTRRFYPRTTSGPQGEEIPDLIEWARQNWQEIILKPVHGYSGQGIIIGYKEKNKDQALKIALESGDYIIQQLVPLKTWAEEFPWLDKERKKLFLKTWQTDFRCFITDKGLIGFVTRFGGIPTNVGAGGGVQSTAILRGSLSLGEAVKLLNESILKLDFNFVWKLQQEIEQLSKEIGNVYLLGPIMTTLRPRIITHAHIQQLEEYGKNLWKDALTLETLWLKGRLKEYVQISPEEEEISRLQPWQGKPALIASDGLFGFF